MQVIQLLTVHAVHTVAINPYPASQVAAAAKEESQVAIPVRSAVHAVHPLFAALAPYPSSQRVHVESVQVKQLSPQSEQTLSAKY